MLEGVLCCPWTIDKQQCHSLSLLSGISVCICANKLVRTNNQPLFGFSNKRRVCALHMRLVPAETTVMFFVFLRNF